MKTCALVLLLLTVLSVPASAQMPAPTDLAPLHYEPPPPSGIGALVMGGVGLGLGFINLAAIPVCYADAYPDEAQTACLGASLAVGLVMLGVGIPSLIFGKRRRARYREWRQRQKQYASLEGVSIVPRGSGAALTALAYF